MNSIAHWEKYHYHLIDKTITIQIFLVFYLWRKHWFSIVYISLMQSCLFAQAMNLTIERNKQTIYLLLLSKQELSEVLLLYHWTRLPFFCYSVHGSLLCFLFFCLLYPVTVRVSPKVIKSLLLCAVYHSEKKNRYSQYKLFYVYV